jgi:hypothetical protein
VRSRRRWRPPSRANVRGSCRQPRSTSP